MPKSTVIGRFHGEWSKVAEQLWVLEGDHIQMIADEVSVKLKKQSIKWDQYSTALRSGKFAIVFHFRCSSAIEDGLTEVIQIVEE